LERNEAQLVMTDVLKHFPEFFWQDC
jgi:hypothetical protein